MRQKKPSISVLRNASKFFLGVILAVCPSLVFTQDVEPRRWNTIPIGTQVIGGAYGYSYGKVLFDPLLETRDVNVDVHTLVVSYVHPLKLGKKFGRIDAVVPVSFARWEGLLREMPAMVERNGMGDPRLRFSVHLIGPPAMEAEEYRAYFAQKQKYTVLGLSLAVTLPLGQYNDERLLNLGLNQFIFRPQIGLLHNWGLWSFELTSSLFLFTKNNDFFQDQEREQHALFAAQGHLIKRFKSRKWVSASLGYGLGGQSVVNRQPRNDVRANLLAAFSLGLPLGRRQGLKLVYLRSETLKDIGADTNSLLLVWTAAF